MTNTTLHRIINLVSDLDGIDRAALSGDTHVLNDIGYDSLDQVEFIMAVEDEFGIEIDDEQAYGMLTLQQTADVVDNIKS